MLVTRRGQCEHCLGHMWPTATLLGCPPDSQLRRRVEAKLNARQSHTRHSITRHAAHKAPLREDLVGKVTAAHRHTSTAGPRPAAPSSRRAAQPSTPHTPQGEGGGEAASYGNTTSMRPPTPRDRNTCPEGTASQPLGRTPKLANACNRPQKSATTSSPIAKTR